MIVYLSGGSEIAETGLDCPPIMLSWFVCCWTRKKGGTNARLRRAIKFRWKKTPKDRKVKTCATHQS